tara:strand:- start:296 stop:1063 length:768 start_codon:yes stop_codon:yes gene_type:complete
MKIRSASHYSTNDKIFSDLEPLVKKGAKILDFGAGAGHMVQRIGEHAKLLNIKPSDLVFPCEVEPDCFLYEDVECTPINLDSKIPFEDNNFDAVYAIEVLEHTSRPYDFMVEAYRVLKPGGVLIISVPNMSHILSRFSLFFTGFSSLFPPPSKKQKNAGRICGHIMPLTFPYFHYGMTRAGFEEINLMSDRLKKSCLFWYILLFPVIKFTSLLYSRKLYKYDSEVWDENVPLVYEMNSMKMLCSRSIICKSQKPT